MLAKRILAASCALALVVGLAGCSRAQATAPVKQQNRLIGAWYDSVSGAEYRFISDSLLVVPHADTNGGNAVNYRILNGNTLDIVQSGSHHISIIDTVTPGQLTLQDPTSGVDQIFYRDMARTTYIKSVEASALAAASNFVASPALPDIVWIAPKPTGKGSGWVTWSTDTLNAYNMAWDWSSLKRDKSPALTSGAGSAMGFSFSFIRKIPTAASLKELSDKNSIEATAGLAHIDVGFAAAKAKYPAGSLVYLPGGLIYSLGDGFAIPIGLDEKNSAFVPLTHK